MKRNVTLLPEDPLLKLVKINPEKDGKFYCGSKLKNFNTFAELQEYYREIIATILSVRNEKYRDCDKNIFRMIIKNVLQIDEKFLEEHFTLCGPFGETSKESIQNHSIPPDHVPGLWCDWTIESDEKGDILVWNGGEKFYNYVEWLEFLIEWFFKPWGYVLNGEVAFCGEEYDDTGYIIIKDNDVRQVYSDSGSSDD